MKKIFLIFSVLFLFMLVSCSRMGGMKDQRYYPVDSNTEEYDTIHENQYQDVISHPYSTFSIDVDSASYSNVRRYLNEGSLPPKDAVRTEELINYFHYDYPEAENGDPINIITEVAPCPWNDNHNLAMIALKGTELHTEEFPSSNLVFLIDVSGSMGDSNKLPLVKASLSLLVNNLRDTDRIAIVTYASSAHIALRPTYGDNKSRILNVIDNLSAGGSTAGGAGIQLAYGLAEDAFIAGGNNRVILATDGDFNVGISSTSELTRLIESKRDNGIYLSVLGFGMGNLKDDKLETLADKGNGNYAYIDNLLEARKVLVEQMAGTLLTIAKDVKVQVEFNPGNIKAYRLIGYENRLLNDEDFNDDNVDAGDIGAGFVVTAFFEMVPVDSDESIPGVDDLKYQDHTFNHLDELMHVKLRYKLPQSDESSLNDTVIKVADFTTSPSDNYQFASAVAEFGLLLFDSQYKGNANYNDLISQATLAKGEDENGYRAEFIRLANLAKDLSHNYRDE